jgi:hypothetical protein
MPPEHTQQTFGITREPIDELQPPPVEEEAARTQQCKEVGEKNSSMYVVSRYG